MRDKLDSELPGPGTFNINYDWATLKKNAGFGTSLRGNVSPTRVGAVPGPGNYNPNSNGGAPAFSMRIKTTLRSSLDKSPGPGAYNPKIDVSKENLGGVKIGKGTRDSQTNF